MINMNVNLIIKDLRLVVLGVSMSIALLCTAPNIFGQNVGINSSGTTPDASAMLDIIATNKGLLIPSVALTATNVAAPVTTPATSLIVYNTAVAGAAPNNVIKGFYYWDGTKWVKIQDVADGTDWHVNGNASTVATNFLGTTDNVPLNFRVNNQKAGRIGVTADASAFWGYQAGNLDDLSNNKNSFIGYQSGANTTNGFSNTGIGYQSLNGNTIGSSNTSAGYQSMYKNTTGYQNTASGAGAMYNNTTGYQNSVAGYQTLYSNLGGYGNTASGFQALYSNTSGYLNTAYGYKPLYSNNTGSYNIGIGAAAMYSNTSGQHNIAIGDSALYTNTSTDSSIAIGNRALFRNTTGFGNIAVGTNAMYANTTGNRNLVAGHNALYSNDTHSYNTAVGNYALYSCKSDYNTAFGYKSLYSTTTGNANTAVGAFSLFKNTTGFYNVVGGDSVMYSNIIGNENVALGKKALFNCNASYNVAMGAYALYNITTGAENVAIGYNAGRFIANGTTANQTSNTSVYIGNETKAFANGDANEIVIGYNAIGLGSNTAVLGNNSITFTGLRSGVGIGTTAPTATVHVKGSTGYNQLRLETSYTPPTSATASGNNGDIAWDATYMYVRVGSSWKRTATFTTW